MNKTYPFLLLILSSFIRTGSLKAQGYQNDTSYYERFPEKLTVRLHLSQKYIHLNFPSAGKPDDLEYKANPKLNLGAGISYKGFSLNFFNGFGFLNKNYGDKGKTKGFDFQFQLFPRKWSIDVLYLSPKGYHMEPKGAAGAQAGTYYYRADIKTTFLGISAYQVPNKERFSYRAALQQTEWQKKSAGSFLYGGEIHHGTLEGDSALVPALYSHIYPQAGINKINIISFGPGAGYAHTFVIRQHFFFMGSMVLNLDLNFTTEEGVKKEKATSLNPSQVFKAAIGYNSRSWNVSATWKGSGFWAKGASSAEPYFFPAGTIRFIVAHRFNMHKRNS